MNPSSEIILVKEMPIFAVLEKIFSFHVTTSRRFRGRRATSFGTRDRMARGATSEKRKRLLKGGVFNFEIVDLLLEGGELRSV